MRLLIIAIAFALSACATEYQSSSFSGGYSDQMTGNNTATVMFKGNGFTNATTTRRYALKRAAELTLQRGYDYFLIESSNDFTKTTELSGTVNCTTSFGYTTCSESGGGSIEKPRTQLDIRMFHGDVPNETGYYDARYLAY